MSKIKSISIDKKILITQILKAALSIIPGGSSIKELIIGTYEKGLEKEADELNRILLKRIGTSIEQLQTAAIKQKDLDYAIRKIVKSQRTIHEQLIIEMWNNLKNSTNIENIITIQEYISDRAKEVAENTPWGTNIFTLPIIVEPEKVDMRSIDAVLRLKRRCVIIGKPASGKSTAISRILLTAPKQNWLIPINLLKNELKTPAEVKELACCKLNITSSIFLKYQSEGRFVFIFDCLSEYDISDIATSFYTLSTTFISSKYLITCRTHEYKTEARKYLIGFQPYEIQDLTWSNQKEYIANHTGDNKTVRYLLKIFKNDKELQEVCSNPFIFIMATLLIPEKQISPKVSSEFYELFLQRFLRSMHWRRRTIKLTDIEKREYLEEVAFRMTCMQESKTSIQLQQLKQLLKDIGIANFNIVLNEHFLGNGLLEKIDGYVRFIQHTLQEFLFASWLVNNAMFPKKLQRDYDGSLRYGKSFISPKCEQFYRELTGITQKF